MEQVEGLRPARLSVGIISAGRVGTALGVALERAESRRGGVQRDISGVPVSGPNVGCPTPRCCPPTRSRAAPSCCCSRCPMPSLHPLSPGWPPRIAVRPGTIVAHTSGANGIAVLSPLTEQDCIPLAIHPAMTFTGADEDIAPTTGHLLRRHRRRRRRLRHCAVAGARDRRRTVPGPRGRPNAVPRGACPCQQPRRDRRARRRRRAAVRVMGPGVARPGTRRRRIRAGSPSG